MARVTFGWVSGETLTYGAYQPDGTVRTAAGTSLPEISSTGYYTASDANIQTGDLVIVNDGSDNVGWGEYHSEVILSSDGLDSVSTTEPSGKASNFREQMVQLWRRFFGKTTLSDSQLLTYKADGTTVATTQSVSETRTLQSQGEAS
jgi:hypothetical protein